MMEGKIAFTGKAGSGKSLAAHFFTRKGYNLHSFAEPIKRIVKYKDGMINPQQVLEYQAKDLLRYSSEVEPQYIDRVAKTLSEGWTSVLQYDYSNRELYQKVGTEYGRDAIPRLWIDYLLGTIRDERRVVVDDVRFVSEADALRGEGFTIVKLEAPYQVRRARLEGKYGTIDPAWESHPSEQEIDLIEADYTFMNDGDNDLATFLNELEEKSVGKAIQ